MTKELTFRKRKRALTDVYRKKAQLAIASIKEHHTVFPESHSYCCSMTDNFLFKETKTSAAEYKVDVSWETLTPQSVQLRKKVN